MFPNLRPHKTLWTTLTTPGWKWRKLFQSKQQSRNLYQGEIYISDAESTGTSNCHLCHLFTFSKEKEIAGLQQNVDDQAAEIAALQKRVRELEARIEELEEDLENERNSRNRVKKL